MELISYAADFVSYFIQNLKEMDRVKSIIFFGSAARNEAGKKSDVDIFIDVFEEGKVEKEAVRIRDKFFYSVKFKKYWKLFGIKNEISLVVGKLEKWKLRDSMLGSSIILYQKYSPLLEKGKNFTILSWGNIKPNSKRVMLNKKVYGYLHYGKRYKGILDIYGGKKIGANVILVPTESLNQFLEIFKRFKIPVKITRIFEYEK